jgi:septal ring factor EnvC (AmiA/AmiB activator)
MPRPGTAVLQVGLQLAVALLAMAALPRASAASASQTATDLARLRERIERVSREVGHDALEKDRLAAKLREAELAVAGARRDLDGVHAEVVAHMAQRAALAAEREREHSALLASRASLAQQLRVAYLLGRNEPLELLLNQQDPAQASRMFAYYGYFGRARAGQIASISERMHHIDTLDGQLAEQEKALAQLQSDSHSQLQRLEGGRDQRQQALANLQVEARSRSASLARLRSQQADLEHLLRELSRVVRPSTPLDGNSVFGRQRGQLDWPVSGKLAASFGEVRASGVNWQGTVVSTTRGAPVHAVSAGRVIYADWLPGLGLLTIVDHGAGYLSLYGYNDSLRKAAGESVASGEVIATAGDSGGRPEPQLYFEIRRGGKPQDPRPWFRRRTPD